MSTFLSKEIGFSWGDSRPARADDGTALLKAIDTFSPSSIFELGPGLGSRAIALLQRFRSADYLGFEPSPALLLSARTSISTYAERAAVEGRSLAIQLPLESGAADLALCLDLLEYLRMDELYMMISESRRALRPGSLFVLRCLSHGNGLRGKIAAAAHAWIPKLFSGSRPLELSHYVSPEDWLVISNERVPDGWLSRQTVVLERLPAPVANE